MSKKIAYTIAAAVILAGAGTTLHSQAQMRAATAVDRALADLPNGATAQRGAIQFVALEDAVTVEDVRISLPRDGGDPIEIAIARMSMTGFEEDSDTGHVKAEAILLEGVAIATILPMPAPGEPGEMMNSDVTLSTDTVSVKNYDGRNFKSVKIGSLERSLKEYIDFLTEAEFDKFDVKNLRYAIANEQMSQTFSIADTSLAEMKDGVLKAYAGSDLKGQITIREGGDDVAFDYHVDSYSGKNISMAGYMEFMFPKEKSSAEAPMIKMAEYATISGFKMTGEKGIDFSIETILMNDFRMRPLPLDELVKLDEDSMGEEKAVELISEMLGIFKIGSMEMKDMRFATEFGEHMTLESVKGKGVGYVGSDEFSINKLSIGNIPESEVSPVDAFSMETMSFTGFDFEEFIKAAIPFSMLPEEEQQARALELIIKLPPSMSYRIAEIKLEKNGEVVASLDEYSGSIDLQPGTLYGDSEFAIEALDISLDIIPDETVQGIFDALGYDRFGASISGKFSFEEDGGRLSYGPINVEIEEGGTLEGKVILIGLRPEMMATPEQAMAAMAGISLSDVNLSYQDNSLVERGLNLVASQSGMEVEQARGIVLQTGMMGLTLFAGTEFGESASNALATFMNEPGTLSIARQSAQPVPVMQVILLGQMEPQSVPELLKLTVSAN